MNKEKINIPVTILCGFLGSGKTTFLNHMISKDSNTRYAIIENEFGEQGIDNELIIRPDETIVELNDGCLCCTLNDNLYDLLNELHSRRDQFDEILIEATGVADPSGLAEPFIAHPIVKKHFPLKAIICLVDAEQIEDHIETTEEAMNQVAFSDIILINKMDLISESYLDSLKDVLKEINPLANIYSGNKDDFPQLEYTRVNDTLDDLLNKAKEKFQTEEKLNFPVQKPHHHHHHHHTKEVNSETFIFDRPFDLQKLNLQLNIFLTFQSRGLYRLKGLIWIENEEEQYVLQSVGKRYDLEKKRLWKEGEEKKTILVFIGKNLQRKGLERFLKSCFVNERINT